MNLPNRRFQRRNRWLNPLVQLAAAAFVCVALPFLAQIYSLPQGWHDPEARATFWIALAALTIGFWLHRSVSDLPGTRESSGILPSYLTSFGLVLTAILLFRIDYSRAILVLSFFMTLTWFFVIYVVTQRKTRLALGVVDGGRVDLFDAMTGVEARRLGLDEWPETLDAVTADFRHDHSDEWEARLADFTLAGIPVYHAKDLDESLTGRADVPLGGSTNHVFLHRVDEPEAQQNRVQRHGRRIRERAVREAVAGG